MATPPPHDASYRLLFSFPEMVRELLRDFLDAGWVRQLDLDSLEPVESAYVSEGLATRADDLVWRVKLRRCDGKPAAGSKAADGGKAADEDKAAGRADRAAPDEWLYLYLIVEFQSRDDPTMAIRVMTYLGLLYQKMINSGRIRATDPLPPVFPLVIYTGVGRWRAAGDIADMLDDVPDALQPYTPRLRYHLLDEHRIAQAAHAAGRPLPASLAGVAVGIETAGSQPEMQQLFRTLLAQLALLPPDRSDALGRAFTEWINRVMVRRLDLDENERLLANIQEVGMLAEGRGDLAEIFRNEGREDGREKLLLDQLTYRFGPLPEEVVTRVKSGSADDIHRWGRRVLSVGTLADVFAADA